MMEQHEGETIYIYPRKNSVRHKFSTLSELISGDATECSKLGPLWKTFLYYQCIAYFLPIIQPLYQTQISNTISI